jgi:hypothetical protein
LAWIGAVIFGALALLSLLVASDPPAPLRYLAAALLGLASLLLLPILWERVQNRWINTIRIIVAIVLAYVGSFAIPVTSHVTLLMPKVERR